MRVEDLLHDQRREAERRLVEQQQARPAISARAIDSICCSPPESVPPRWSSRSFSRGKEREDALEILVEMLRAVERRAHLQVFQHRHARKDAPALGRLRDPQPRDLVRRQSA